MNGEQPSIKKPRLFYYEEAENCWAPLPEKFENVIQEPRDWYDGETQEIQLKCAFMTDEEFANLEEM